MHFTAMGAVLIMPDPARVNGATSVSPASLSLVIAGVAAIILGICLAVALSDRQSKGKLRQQKILLDTALENMSQGLCMFDADGHIVLFNERYAKMMGLPAASLKGSIPARPDQAPEGGRRVCRRPGGVFRARDCGRARR